MAIEIHHLNFEGLVDVFTIVKSMISRALGNQGVTTEGDGAAYTAKVNGIKELKAGATFVMIPHVTSTSVTATLNVNDLGGKAIRRRVSNSTVTTVAPSTVGWLVAGKPVRVTYDGTYWIADLTRPNANDIYGTIDIPNGGTGASTADGARANLGAQAQHLKAAVTLSQDGWENNQQTVAVPGVTADNTIIPGAAVASRDDYADNGIYCSAQADGALTFTCESVPTTDIIVNVVMLG